jgi:hypothetical protein
MVRSTVCYGTASTKKIMRLPNQIDQLLDWKWPRDFQRFELLGIIMISSY